MEQCSLAASRGPTQVCARDVTFEGSATNGSDVREVELTGHQARSLYDVYEQLRSPLHRRSSTPTPHRASSSGGASTHVLAPS